MDNADIVNATKQHSAAELASTIHKLTLTRAQLHLKPFSSQSDVLNFKFKLMVETK